MKTSVRFRMRRPNLSSVCLEGETYYLTDPTRLPPTMFPRAREFRACQAYAVIATSPWSARAPGDKPQYDRVDAACDKAALSSRVHLTKRVCYKAGRGRQGLEMLFGGRKSLTMVWPAAVMVGSETRRARGGGSHTGQVSGWEVAL
jgi:hypothetical protein